MELAARANEPFSLPYRNKDNPNITVTITTDVRSIPFGAKVENSATQTMAVFDFQGRIVSYTRPVDGSPEKKVFDKSEQAAMTLAAPDLFSRTASGEIINFEEDNVFSIGDPDSTEKTTIRIGPSDTATITENGEERQVRLEPGRYQRIGSSIGPIIGAALADTHLERIVYGSVLGSFLLNVGQEIDDVVAGQDTDPWSDFWGDLEGVAIGSISGFMVSQLLDAFGVEGTLETALFSAVTTPAIETILTGVASGELTDLTVSEIFDSSEIITWDFLENLAVTVISQRIVAQLDFIDPKTWPAMAAIGPPATRIDPIVPPICCPNISSLVSTKSSCATMR